MSARRVLVTGAGGFIGGAVVRSALARGHQVTALTRTPLSVAPAGVRNVVADLTSAPALHEALAGIDTVIHCAAAMSPDPLAQERDTLAATRALVAAMPQAGVGRIVLAGSFAVYDTAAVPVGGRLDERTPLAPDAEVRGAYIVAKLAQEALVRDAVPALDWRIVRPGLVFGPGRTWFYHLGLHLHPRLWVALAGAATLPLTYVDNCADALMAAAEADGAGITVNVVDDDLPTRRAYLEALATVAEPRPSIVDLPWTLLAAGGRAANLVGVSAGMLHPSRLSARCRPLTYANAEAKARLGWQPRVSMREALARSTRA